MANRILTTHVGSLPRPASLLQKMQAQASGEAVDPAALAADIAQSVKDVVARQVSLGIDLVSDGEFSKPSYATYIVERLTGFGGESKGDAAADLRAFPEFAQQQVRIGAVVPRAGGACCQGPVAPKANDGLASDIANLKAAVEASQPTGAFINAASPGVVAVFQKNEFYPDEDSYIEAVAEALRPEYEAIVAAGFSVQLDSPDLAMSRHLTYADMDEESFLKIVDRNVAALNHATRNIPADRMRMHVCWGNYAGPHHFDIPFAVIAPRVLKARPQMVLLEGANPRHGHDWAVFRDVSLPEDKILVPGVIDSTSNYVDHPELVAERLLRYADVVGRDRLAAGSDCGFSTFSGVPTVFPDIAWLKLKSLVEGAAIATDRLWQPVH
ncbi:5-methyltetrahydropteroyltriglutamate--homocysteine methyltransferase [Novosphingobium sp. CF614]|uniref:cobalamin-independent methionine synthase II family protein n=1 Tax=Novosphingobium sp. CF614 TaxID=1884364 RepID=UPI0008E4494A|nr:cobalamin-independent methionine synthase II family protein [Novosphingobium sp. CF614]SFG22061.1 5-methyltetrahydropteroyltriglutamate--homocysteine methyltransferase [Novosphingobium sp. CF614]